MLELALTTFNRELYEQGLREEGAREVAGSAEARGEEKMSTIKNII